MSTVNQKEYLKRYLSKDKDKKKKKKKVLKGVLENRVKIIDDNLDVQEQVQTIQDIENNDEDAPQVVAVIDDRPVELRMNSFKDSSNWTTVDIKPKIKEEPLSPERNCIKTPPRRRYSDESPPRQRKGGEKPSDDESPPRRRKKYDSDESPPRNRESRDDLSPPRIKKVDQSPARRRNRRDSDESPLRRGRNNEKSSKSDNYSPPRRTKRDDDESPPRRGRNNGKSSKSDDCSPPRRTKRDNSPPRRSPRDESPPRRRNRDQSPPTRRRSRDQSPPRSKKRDDSPSRSRNPSRKSRWASKSPSPKASTSKPSTKATKTLDGKTAGLQNAKDLVKETESFRKREAQLFQEMSAEVSGVNAATVMRDRKTGRLRDLEAEAEEKLAQTEKTNELQKKYDRWGKGVKQTEDYKQKLEEAAYEMSKPLARYADDADLERHLKEQERAGDPMLAYIKKKRKDEAVKAGVKLKPEYMGEFMPNRYGIRPGHRWDGVDRSNGYEKKWFDAINKRNADREEAYRWNSEDM